jgi:hypothetical protein
MTRSCGPLEDPEAAICGFLDVLAGDDGQQLARPRDPRVQPFAAQGIVSPVGVADQRVHQLLAGGGVVPVAGRLPRCGVVVLATQPRSHLRLEQACAALTRAVEGVRGSLSAMRYERLHTARSYLDAWRWERFVHDLDEQLTAVAATL